MDFFFLLPRALAAALCDMGLAGAVGALLSSRWIPAASARLLQCTLRASAGALVVALPWQLWLLTSSMLGGGTLSQIAAQLPDVLTGTHAGRVLIPAFALSLLLLAASFAPRTVIHLQLAVVVVLLAARSLSGHAASDGDGTLRELLQFVHLAAMSVWAGGVAVAGLIVIPRLDREAVPAYGRRLSQAATIAVLLVALSGIYSAYRGLGPSLRPLVHTQWGGFLLAKVLLVLTALALGATNRRILAKPQPDTARFAALLRVEAIVMFGILLLSGFLANSPPASEM